MEYNKSTNSILFEKQEKNIINTAILELGGPLHSPFAKHLLKYHENDYKQVRKELDSEHGFPLGELHLVSDVLRVFLVEPLEKDWGTIYDDIKHSEVKELIDEIKKISEREGKN